MTRDIGRVLRKGRIRVDARKAMAKLREHLLVDLHLYAVEVVRAAVLAGATRIDVAHDADDVVISFDGATLEPAALPHLFEHLTGDDGSGAGHHQRLLALAVNAAVGLQPAWVSLVTSIDGAASRVTWSPALVAAIEREEKPLPEPESIAAPPGMPANGTRFHLRRKVGWETVRRATAKSAPREVALLTAMAHCLRVPLFVNGAAPAPAPGPRVLARASISLPGVRRAHVEIVTGHETAPHVDFCELGVLLCRTSFAFGRHFPMAEHQGVRPPVRIVIDSDALPTNASRSAVREDAPLFGALASTAAPALSDAIAAVAATLLGRGAAAEGVSVDARDPALLHDALGAFLCAAEASLIARVPLPDALREVLDLPLFQDGLGRPMTHAGIPREDPLLVWTREHPVPPEMEPWAHTVVWRRGRVAERVLASRVAFDPEKLADLVKRGAARHKKLFAMPPAPVRAPDGAYLAREVLRFDDDGPLAGLSGEVAVPVSPSAHVSNLAVRVFLQGRFYEAFPLPEGTVPLPCVIAVQWPGHVEPKLGYEGIEATEGARRALKVAVRQAVFLCEGVAANHVRAAAQRSLPIPPLDDGVAAVLRAALATVVTAPARFGGVEGFEMPALVNLQGLVRAPIWPTSDGALVSLQALCEHVAKTGALCVAAPGSAGSAVDGRPVVTLTTAEVEHLSRCLREGVAIVSYTAALVAPSAPGWRERARLPLVELVDRQAAVSGAPVLRLEGKGVSCAVTLGGAGTHVWHAGILVSRIELDDSFGGITIAIDDDTIVPTAAWNGILYADDQAVAARAERAFAQRVVAAILGDPRSRTELVHAISGAVASASWVPRIARPAGSEPTPFEWPEHLTALSPAVQRFLVDRAARGRFIDARPENRELAEQIEQMPFLTMLRDGDPVPASLADIAAIHEAPAPIPYLRSAPLFRPVRWQPLVVKDDALLDALARWSGGRTKDASGELFEQSRIAALEGDLVRFRARPTIDPRAVGVRGDVSSLVHLPGSGKQRKPESVTVALPIVGIPLAHALVEVTFEGRLVGEQELGELALPVIARVDVVDRDSLEGFERLSRAGVAAVTARVARAAAALGVSLLERAREPGAAHTFFGDARVLSLVLGLLSLPDRDPRVDDGLRGNVLRWPTVQGDERLFGELRLVDGELWIGAAAYSSWATAAAPSELDRPILLVPATREGELLTAILQRLGLKLRVVTEAVASLQASRSRGGREKPRLAARPPHPALARDLDSLLVEGMEGEMALYDSGDAVAELSSLDGETRRVPLDLSFPARAVARMDVLTSSSAPIAAQKLARAAVRFLVSLTSSFDTLPVFVRAHLRALTCRAVQQGREVPAAARAAPVFPDVDGKWWSLADLTSDERSDWLCTFDPPPYSRSRQEGRTLALTPTEHLQLHAKIKILNVTEWMRRDLEAERRREAPQVAEIRFDPAARAGLLSSFVVADGSLEGEIGLLRPAVDGARGAQVFTTRRPVCTVDDAPGWPLAAVLNDDTLRPNRWWTELLPAQETALRARLRALATNHIRESFAADVPRDALATVFLDEPVPPIAAYGSTEPMTITGHLFLPARWPTTPTVRLFVQKIEESAATPIAIASAVIQPRLPIGGVIFLSHGAPFVTAGAASRAALALRDAAARMLAPLVQKNTANREIQTYQWNFRLLGATAAGEPTATSADGRALTADDVIAALQDKGEIWLTDRQGSIEGDFPRGEEPSFLLVDDGSPLVRVLRARLPAEKIRWLGARSAEKARPSPEEVLAPPSIPPPGPPPPLDARPAGAAGPSRSWLSDVLDRVRSYLVNAPLSEDDETGIGAAVERTLRALRLRDDPVITVHEVTRGRLVQYDKLRRVVSINVEHPAIAGHLAAPSQTILRRACIALVAASLSEVNIALAHVTDHDEEQALLELLRQEAAAGAAGAATAASAAGTASPAAAPSAAGAPS